MMCIRWCGLTLLPWTLVSVNSGRECEDRKSLRMHLELCTKKDTIEKKVNDARDDRRQEREVDRV